MSQPEFSQGANRGLINGSRAASSAVNRLYFDT
jgi:hypothetical protein